MPGIDSNFPRIGHKPIEKLPSAGPAGNTLNGFRLTEAEASQPDSPPDIYADNLNANLHWQGASFAIDKECSQVMCGNNLIAECAGSADRQMTVMSGGQRFEINLFGGAGGAARAELQHHDQTVVVDNLGAGSSPLAVSLKPTTPQSEPSES